MPQRQQTFQKKHPTLANLIVIVIVVLFIGLVYTGYKTSKGPNGDLSLFKIAVIPIKGEIGIGGSVDPTETIKEIKKADKDLTVKAIILEINSPGGSVVPTEEIAKAVKDANKPVVSWIREVGASGAYWIASASDKIVADPASLTGSIGVTSSYLQFSKLLDTYGVTYERLVTGKFKDAGSEFKELTPDERAYLQSKIDVINELFIDTVAENRKLPRENVAKLATGEIFLGSEALDLGLVDVLGGKEDAKKAAQALAGITHSKLVSTKDKNKGLIGALSQEAKTFAYFLGKGIGEALTPLSAEKDFSLKAELN